MKMVVYAVVVSVLYLVVMSFVNKKLDSLDFANNGVVEESVTPSYLTVTIKGAIKHPGTYTALPGETLEYLVTLAGGVNEDADSKSYNLEALLKDNGTYYIGSVSNEGKISINDATIAELDTLPGIGNVLAKRIVSYRNSNGDFTTIEDITHVSGIGESLFEQIKDLISL